MSNIPAWPFWLVWCEDGGSPTRKHLTADAAKEEARRLANLNPGQRFFVLCPFAYALRKEPVEYVQFTADDFIPF